MAQNRTFDMQEFQSNSFDLSSRPNYSIMHFTLYQKTRNKIALQLNRKLALFDKRGKKQREAEKNHTQSWWEDSVPYLCKFHKSVEIFALTKLSCVFFKFMHVLFFFVSLRVLRKDLSESDATIWQFDYFSRCKFRNW